jgi:hypothetical protein
VDERFSLGLVCVWLVLSLLRAVELLRSAIWLRGIARRAVPIQAAPGVAELLAGTPRAVTLCVSREVDRPSVVGFFTPRILVPQSLLARLSDGELAQIVLHELEHLRRRDDWTNLLQKLSLVLFPLNPVLLWIERRLCLERELACDDQVLRTTHARKAYAACLANLAEHSLVRRGVSLALGAWERQSELVRRVHRILLNPDREMGRRQIGVAVGLMIFGLVGGVDVLAHSPRLVSFEPAMQWASTGSVQPGLVQDVVFRPDTFPHSLESTGKSLRPLPSCVRTRLQPCPDPASGPKARDITAWAAGTGADTPPIQGLKARHIASAKKARLTFVKAQMPARKTRQIDTVPVVSPAPTERDVTLRSSVQPNPLPAPEAGAMVVLVTWRAVSTAADAPPAPTSSGFSYAAVPLRNGWLFVQL